MATSIIEPEARVDCTVADLHKSLLPKDAVQQSHSQPEHGAHSSVSGDRKSLAQAVKAPGGFRREFHHGPAGDAREEWDGKYKVKAKHWGTAATRYKLFVDRQGLLGIDEDGNHIEAAPGTASVCATTMALVKGFVGSGITFLPGAFANGGWELSCVSLVIIGVLNLICIRLLLECRDKTNVSDYGQIAFQACGWMGEFVVQASVVAAQFGTCVAFIIFVLTNAESLELGLSAAQIVAIQMLVLVPFCWIRNVHSLETPNILADILIVGGLVAIIVFECMHIRSEGSATDLEPVKVDTAFIFFGCAMQSLEGIPSLLPIRAGMKEPNKFWNLILAVFVLVVILYVVFGAVGYSCFGDSVQTPVLLSLPQAPWVTTVKSAYMVALVLSVPLFFIPCAQVTEFWAFGPVKKGTRKNSKNLMRSFEILAFGFLAWKCAASFDKFLGLVGGLCATPIAFVFPALFHLILVAEGVCAKLLDILLVVFGAGAMILVLWQAV